MTKVIINTDGGSQPNPGVGAWAAVLRYGEHTKELSGGELYTTNNRMELMAAIEALSTLKRRSEVELHTDSQYVKNGITTWIAGWKRNNWKRMERGKPKPVKNEDLWRRLDELCTKHDVDWAWVRGHAGHTDNERCDELCNEVIGRLTANSTKAERQAAKDAADF
ncbi:MAG: ribonuclease HI [Sumerlaeia bacterium]